MKMVEALQALRDKPGTLAELAQLQTPSKGEMLIAEAYCVIFAPSAANSAPAEIWARFRSDLQQPQAVLVRMISTRMQEVSPMCSDSLQWAVGCPEFLAISSRFGAERCGLSAVAHYLSGAASCASIYRSIADLLPTLSDRERVMVAEGEADQKTLLEALCATSREAYPAHSSEEVKVPLVSGGSQALGDPLRLEEGRCDELLLG
uniref:Uncharacterized protein n=1 Tax=Oxyrrhis marina TaxID=2969 RepID=A0A7S3UIW0_OXYMA